MNAKQIFLVFFASYFGLLLRVANDWFPFTPTSKSETGLSDLYRYSLSCIFLFFAPAIHFLFVISALSQEPPPIIIPSGLPGFSQAVGFVVLLSLVIPPLGLYDLWQIIVRRWPDHFYSEFGRERIEERFPNAFSFNFTQALLIALIWLLVPWFAYLAFYVLFS